MGLLRSILTSARQMVEATIVAPGKSWERESTERLIAQDGTLSGHRRRCAFLDDDFPAAARQAPGSVVSVLPGRVRMELKPTRAMTRAGGIVSGPALMAFADVGGYAVIAATTDPSRGAIG